LQSCGLQLTQGSENELSCKAGPEAMMDIDRSHYFCKRTHYRRRSIKHASDYLPSVFELLQASFEANMASKKLAGGTEQHSLYHLCR